MTPDRLFLLDGHALCYRAFFAVRELRNSRGVPTNAVFGFWNILRKIRREFCPAYLAVCFDTGKKTHRQERYAEYKVQRPAMPEDLARQIPLIKDLIGAYRIRMVERDGYEADDCIATLTSRFSSRGIDVVIVTDDKDMYQLVNDRVMVYSSRREKLMSPQDTVERFGVPPGHIIDYLALAGDASDNIPGVEGVGEVTARKLVAEYGSLENLYASLAALKSGVRARLEQGRDSAFFSRDLARLDHAVPLEAELEDFRCVVPQRGLLEPLMKDFEFRGFESEWPAGSPDDQPDRPDTFHGPSELAIEKPVLVLEDTAALTAAVKIAGSMCLRFVPQDSALHDGKGTFWIGADGKVLPLGSTEVKAIGGLLADPGIGKICANSKEIFRELQRCGLVLAGEVFDIHLAGYLLRSGRSGFSVPELAAVYLDSSLEGDAAEVAALERLRQPLAAGLAHEALEPLYRDVELPLSRVLAGMELEGVALDVPRLNELSHECERAMQELFGKITALAGCEFNLNSPKQLGHVLFEVLGLPITKKSKTGPSTDEEVLTRLAQQHEIPALVLEYRGLAKLKSTYVDALPRMVDVATGRIHCLFDQTGTETGRLSSQRPNVQNIPVRTTLGRRVRGAFVASGPGRCLLAADYSQIELRVLAHLADEQNMKEAFAQGEDIHTYTAGLMFDVSPGQVTQDMRYNAKRINFGIVYGMSAYGLSRDLGIAPKEAQQFIDRYFTRYPGIRDFMDNTVEQARRQGYVTTLFHRRRYLPDINSRNQAVRQFAERQAINTPVQGTAADLIKMAMVRLDRELAADFPDVRMIMTIHDELVFDIDRKSLEAAAGIVRRVMEHAAELSVPLVATVKTGPDMADLKTL